METGLSSQNTSITPSNSEDQEQKTSDDTPKISPKSLAQSDLAQMLLEHLEWVKNTKPDFSE